MGIKNWLRKDNIKQSQKDTKKWFLNGVIFANVRVFVPTK